MLPKGAVGRITRRFEIALEGVAYLIPPLHCFVCRGDGGSEGARVNNS